MTWTGKRRSIYHALFLPKARRSATPPWAACSRENGIIALMAPISLWHDQFCLFLSLLLISANPACLYSHNNPKEVCSKEKLIEYPLGLLWLKRWERKGLCLRHFSGPLADPFVLFQPQNAPITLPKFPLTKERRNECNDEFSPLILHASKVVVIVIFRLFRDP